MTIRELYEWANENDCEDLKIQIRVVQPDGIHGHIYDLSIETVDIYDDAVVIGE